MSAELHALRALCLLALFSGLWLALRHVSGLPALALNRLGVRGSVRAQTLHASPAFRALDPIVRWIAARVDSFLPRVQLAKLDQTLARAGDPLGASASEFVAIACLIAVAGAVLGTGYAVHAGRSALYGVFGALVAGALPLVRVEGLAEKRARNIEQSLPAVVDLLCLSLSAGLDFPAAVRQVVEQAARAGDALADELGLVLRELSLGKTRREALEGFAARNPGPLVQEFVAAVIQAEEEGTQLADVLRIQASLSRQRRSARAEEAASRAGLQLLLPIVLVFVAVLLLIGGPLVLRLMTEFARAA